MIRYTGQKDTVVLPQELMIAALKWIGQTIHNSIKEQHMQGGDYVVQLSQLCVIITDTTETYSIIC